jgi:hypothetical protein
MSRVAGSIEIGPRGDVSFRFFRISIALSPSMSLPSFFVTSAIAAMPS